MHFRRNNVQDTEGDALTSYEVAVYPIGAVVQSTTSNDDGDQVINIRPPHSFKVGDKFLRNPASDAEYSGIFTVASLTATSITMTEGSFYTMSAGDVLVNLGPDGSSGSTPDFDQSPMGIYTEPQGVTEVSQARVTVNSSGEYEYYYRGDGAAWEVILDSDADPVDVIRGYGWQHRMNIADFGASTAKDDNDTYIRSAIVAAQQLDLPVRIPRGQFNVESVLVDDPVTIEGSSVHGSIIASTAATGTAFSVSAMSTTHDGNKYFVMRNLRLTQEDNALNSGASLLSITGAINHVLLENVFIAANTSSDLTANGTAITITQAEKATLREVQVVGYYTSPTTYYWGVGVDIGPSTTVACGNVVLVGCNIERATTGVRVASSATAAVRNVLLLGTRLKHGETGIPNSGTGVLVESNCGNLTLQNCHLEKYDIGVDINGADQISIRNCYLTGGDQTSTDLVKIHEGCVGVKVDNCYFDSATNAVNFVETTTGTLAELQILGSTFNSTTNSFQDARTDSTRADREIIHLTDFKLYDDLTVTGNLVVTGTAQLDGAITATAGFTGPVVATSLTINESAAPSGELNTIKIYSDPTFQDLRMKFETGNIQVLADKTFNTFTQLDATPDVTHGLMWKTGSDVSNPVTITDFDGKFAGKWFFLYVADDYTSFDFTGTNLKGNGGVDLDHTASDVKTGDSMICFCDGTNWYCHFSDNTV